MTQEPENDSKPKAVDLVAIGGGTGLSTLLSGLKKYVNAAEDASIATSIRRLSAVVAVSDDGGSSGRLRDEFQMPPPGTSGIAWSRCRKIRTCFRAFSNIDSLATAIFLDIISATCFSRRCVK